MSESQEAQTLYNVNKRLVAHDSKQDLPLITLQNGTKVQTGTVGALLDNIRLYDRVCKGEEIEGWTKELLEQAISVAIPTLNRVGMFDLFRPDEWLAGSSPGRRLVGARAKALGI